MGKRDIFERDGRKILCLFIMVCFSISFVWGCAARSEYFSKKEADASDVRKVAVLPLENLTGESLASEKVRRAIIAELLVSGIAVVEPGEITRVVKELNISSPTVPDGPQLKEMGEKLGVEYIMGGAVGSYGMRQGLTVSYPEVTIHLMLFEASSGEIVWSAWHTSGGPSFGTRHFGTEGISLSEAVRKVVKETIDMLF